MNNQIRKLYNEAVQYTMANAGRKGQASCNRLCANKFAELIVKECIDYCGENLSKTVGGALKIHFGVEE
jgi:hypothetical protein